MHGLGHSQAMDMAYVHRTSCPQVIHGSSVRVHKQSTSSPQTMCIVFMVYAGYLCGGHVVSVGVYRPSVLYCTVVRSLCYLCTGYEHGYGLIGQVVHKTSCAAYLCHLYVTYAQTMCIVFVFMLSVCYRRLCTGWM